MNYYSSTVSVDVMASDPEYAVTAELDVMVEMRDGVEASDRHLPPG